MPHCSDHGFTGRQSLAGRLDSHPVMMSQSLPSLESLTIQSSKGELLHTATHILSFQWTLDNGCTPRTQKNARVYKSYSAFTFGCMTLLMLASVNQREFLRSSVVFLDV